MYMCPCRDMIAVECLSIIENARSKKQNSTELYLTEIIRGGSQMFIVCLVGVWQRNLNTWCVCVYGTYLGYHPDQPMHYIYHEYHHTRI